MSRVNRVGAVDVLPDVSDGGAVAGDVTALEAWVNYVVNQNDTVVRHLAKLFAHPADEHHLFLRVDLSAMEWAEKDLLCFHMVTPRIDPPAPSELSGLWLAGRFGDPLVWLRGSGWERFGLRPAA